MILYFSQVSDIPEEWKSKLRVMCLPPGRNDPGGGTMYRWTYNDGSTYAMLLFDGPELHPFYLAGWAAVTFQEEPEPVLGVFVDPENRGQGFAEMLVSALLRAAKTLIKERGTDKVIAVDHRYPKYKQLIEAAGFKHKSWD